MPEAILCKSYLVAGKHLQLDENTNQRGLSAESRVWLEAKQLEAQKKFYDAAQILLTIQNPSPR